MHTDGFLAAIERDAPMLATAARKDLDARVPGCPDWDVRTLVGHLGGVYRWATEIVRRASTDPPEGLGLEQPPDDVVGWFEAGADELVRLLRSIPMDTPVWNHMRAEPRVAFWPRRMAHETAIHRVDAQQAQDGFDPIDAELAVDGIDEVLELWLPRGLHRTKQTLKGTIHFHCTDTHGEWLIDTTDGKANVTREHAKGDVAARGTASDLLLYLWGRVGSDRLEVIGDQAVLEGWSDVIGT